MLSPNRTHVLRAVAETIVPADEWPDGWEGGVAQLLERGDDRPDLDRPLDRLADGFPGLDAADRAAKLAALEPDMLDPLLRTTYQAYYGGSRGFVPPAWDMIGYRPLGTASVATDPDPLRTIELSAASPEYDVVVIGSGAGGGVTAMVLAEAGARVLLVERARQHTDAELRGDHLHGKRAQLYDPIAGPGAGHPRVIADQNGATRIVDGAADGWSWCLNALTVGGGTRLWQGMSWRFLPEDFQMASLYGVPPGSTLSDWPITYADLAPFYDRVEWEIGVSGQSNGPLASRTPRTRGYPMPPFQPDPSRRAFGAAADRLGWEWGPIPFAINTVPRAGRAACVRCAQCVGHSSPVDAKNGTHNTVIPRALATGSCDLLTSTQALAIEHSGGVARAVRLVGSTAAGPAERTIRCGRVVVSAGAIETPRLLIVSGLGGPAVGANFHSHSFTLQFGIGPEPIKQFEGPGHSIATLDFVHRNGEAWGGGVLFDAPPPLPLEVAQLLPALGGPSWGPEHKHWMRDRLPYVVGGMGIGQDIPSVRSRVSVEPTVKDVHGMPVAKIGPDVHPATATVRRYMAEHLSTWLAEIGVENRFDTFAALPAAVHGEHSAGTCRMGEDPDNSACDRDGRVHGTTNVYVADASLLPTNGSVNPGETTMANAWRVAEGLSNRR